MISSQLFRCVSISSIYRISELGRSTNFGTKKLPKIILFEWSNLVNTLLKKNWRGDRGGQKNIVTKKMTKVYPVEAFCHQKITKAYPAKAFSNQSLPSAYPSSKPLQTRYHIKPIYYAVDHCLMARWSYEIIVSHADITGCKNHLAEKSCKKLPLVKFLPSWGLKEVWSTRHQKWWITRLWSFLHPSPQQQHTGPGCWVIYQQIPTDRWWPYGYTDWPFLQGTLLEAACHLSTFSNWFWSDSNDTREVNSEKYIWQKREIGKQSNF